MLVTAQIQHTDITECQSAWAHGRTHISLNLRPNILRKRSIGLTRWLKFGLIFPVLMYSWEKILWRPRKN